MRDDLRSRLERLDLPGEHDARVRTWEVVRAAAAERERHPRRRRDLRPIVALAVAAALVAAALTPPGRAVVDEVREAIGVERAAPALFSLPAPGRVLVDSPEGSWIVSPDGSKRLLGPYRESSWSPFGRFVVGARTNELAALEPDGGVRWTLARPDPVAPRWGGTQTDTRIAYLSGGALRVVIGNGRGDHACVTGGAAAVAPAWRPAPGHVVAFATTSGQIGVHGADRCELYWRSDPIRGVRQLVWSPDGARLAVVSRDRLTIFRWNRRTPLSTQRVPGLDHAAFAPDGRLALVVRAAGRSEVRIGGRRVFAGPGRFGQVAFSPDGRWLLVPWVDADQWVFIRGREVRAVSNISEQFGGFPSVAGWCCA